MHDTLQNIHSPCPDSKSGSSIFSISEASLNCGRRFISRHPSQFFTHVFSSIYWTCQPCWLQPGSILIIPYHSHWWVPSAHDCPLSPLARTGIGASYHPYWMIVSLLWAYVLSAFDFQLLATIGKPLPDLKTFILNACTVNIPSAWIQLNWQQSNILWTDMHPIKRHHRYCWFLSEFGVIACYISTV